MSESGKIFHEKGDKIKVVISDYSVDLNRYIGNCRILESINFTDEAYVYDEVFVSSLDILSCLSKKCDIVLCKIIKEGDISDISDINSMMRWVIDEKQSDKSIKILSLSLDRIPNKSEDLVERLLEEGIIVIHPKGMSGDVVIRFPNIDVYKGETFVVNCSNYYFNFRTGAKNIGCCISLARVVSDITHKIINGENVIDFLIRKTSR